MSAESVDEVAVGGERGGFGADHLAAVGDGAQASRAVEGRAEVVAVARLGRSHVHRHADGHRHGSLRGGRGGQRIGWPLEDRHRRVAFTLGLEERAAVRGHGGCDDGVVFGEGGRHGVGVGFPTFRRPDHVGEQEREIGHRRANYRFPPWGYPT